jgi:hypothetical protein
MSAALQALDFDWRPGVSLPGLLPIQAAPEATRIDEHAAIRQAALIGDIVMFSFVAFRIIARRKLQHTLLITALTD